LGTLGGGASSVVTVVVAPQGPGILSTQGSLSSGAPDPDPANNSATASTVVTASLEADLGLAMSDGQTLVTPNQFLTYQITASNAGPWSVDSVVLVDTVPPGFNVFSFVPSAGSYDSATGLWTGLNLGPGQSVLLSVFGQVLGTATGSLVNTAVVDPPAGYSDLVPGNNIATDTDVIQAGWTELGHGTAVAGPLPPGGERFFRMMQRPAASYEVVVDAVSGDLGSVASPLRLRQAPPAWG
jgi:uncharacterized repeat protein (TIGR01451 family)